MAVKRDRSEKRASSACDRYKLDSFSASTILFRFVRRTELEEFLNIFFFDKLLERITSLFKGNLGTAEKRKFSIENRSYEIDLTQRKARFHRANDIDHFFDYVSSTRICRKSLRCLDRHRLSSRTTVTTAKATIPLWPLAFCLRVITSHRKPITTFSLKNSYIGRQIRQIEAEVAAASTRDTEANGTERISFVYKFRLPLASTRKR